jgi:UDP-4-amino-4,6-dideoxy-N-acetyl-beta-L-altrosamine transaminase
VVEVLRGDWLTTGPAVAAFESELSKRTGAIHVAACSSGTAGLHLAALALGLGPGDAVVVPAITFVATAATIRMTGAEVVFADVDADTGLMTPATFEEAIARAKKGMTETLRAVVPVHLGGQCSDPAGFRELADRHGLRIIEDACHSIGTRYADEEGAWANVGSCRHSDIAVFSFHPVKTIAMGEGGAVMTNDEGLARRLYLYRNHAITREAAKLTNREQAFDDAGDVNPWYYEIGDVGFNYRASDIHCALGLSQLSKLDRFVERRAALRRGYEERLTGLAPHLRLASRIVGCRPAWHLCVALVDFDSVTNRADLMALLRTQSIDTQVHYIPLHWHPYYHKRYGATSLPGSESYYARAMSLPLFPGMTDSDLDRVCDRLSDAMERVT